jgi:hypothetical protein
MAAGVATDGRVDRLLGGDFCGPASRSGVGMIEVPESSHGAHAVLQNGGTQLRPLEFLGPGRCRLAFCKMPLCAVAKLCVVSKAGV